MAALVVDRHRDDAARDRAGEIRGRRGRARRACAREPAHARRVDGRVGAFSDFLTRDVGVRRARLRGAVQVLRRLRRRHDGAVRHRPRISAQRLCRDHQGRRARRDADRRLRRRLRGARAIRCRPACGSAASCRRSSNLAFSWQAVVGTNRWALTVAIIAENFTSAIGTVIFVAYLSALCQQSRCTRRRNTRCSPRSPRSGAPISRRAPATSPQATGWPWFFVICALAAIPSLVLLAWLQRRGHFEAPRQADAHLG